MRPVSSRQSSRLHSGSSANAARPRTRCGAALPDLADRHARAPPASTARSARADHPARRRAACPTPARRNDARPCARRDLRRRGCRTRSRMRADDEQAARIAVEAVHDAGPLARHRRSRSPGYRASRPFTSVPVGCARRRSAPRARRAWRPRSRRRRRSARRPSTPGVGLRGCRPTVGSSSISITVARARARWLFPTAAPVDHDRVRGRSSCTSARLQPVINATAWSTRSPASAAGTAIGLVTTDGRRRGRGGARSERTIEQDGSDRDARVGEVEHRPPTDR